MVLAPPQRLTQRVSPVERFALPVLGLIVAVAAVLRFTDLSQRGLIYWDEAKFALEGIRLQALIGSALGAHLAAYSGKAIGTAKPTSALLFAGANAVLGQHDWAPLFLNALLSTAQPVVLFILTRRLFGTVPGLLAALLLAVSEYEIIYARSALTESDGSLIFLIAVTMYVVRALPGGRSPVSSVRTVYPVGHGLLASGSGSEAPAEASDGAAGVALPAVLAGLAFTANYRLIVYVAALGIYDFLVRWRAFGFGPAVRAGGVWAAGFTVFPLLWQVIDVLARFDGVVLFRSELTGRPMYYLQEVLYQIHQGKQSRVEFLPQVYVQWFVLRQGIAPSLLVLAGFVLAALRRTRGLILVATLVLLPWAIYTFAPFVVPRNLEAALPYASTLAAMALVSVLRVLGRHRAWFLLAAALALGATGFATSWRLTAERSGFALAAQYLNRHGIQRSLTTNEIMVFYLRGKGSTCDALPVPGTGRALSRDVAGGYHTAVLDHHSNAASNLVVAGAHLVASYPVAGRLNIGEDPINSENTWPPGQGPRNERVRVYDLSRLKLPPARGKVPLCSRNKAA